MDRYIDLQLLSNYMTVVSTMNMTRAAEPLFISQSALSRQMQSLEKQLGVALFCHDQKLLKLTAAGKSLYTEGKKLLAYSDKVKGRVQLSAKLATMESPL